MPRRRLVTASVTQLRRRWGHYLALSRRADILICRRSVPIGVMMSVARYRRLTAAAARRAGQGSSPSTPASSTRKRNAAKRHC